MAIYAYNKCLKALDNTNFCWFSDKKLIFFLPLQLVLGILHISALTATSFTEGHSQNHFSISIFGPELNCSKEWQIQPFLFKTKKHKKKKKRKQQRREEFSLSMAILCCPCQCNVILQKLQPMRTWRVKECTW